METLRIEKQDAIKAHMESGAKGKKLLENLFGEEIFQKEITDRVKTYQDAWRELALQGHDPVRLPFPDPKTSDEKAANAFIKLTIIARVLNEGWAPDWTNGNQPKYYPWFKINPSGSGLSFYDTGYWCTFTTTASRLCYKSRELAAYAGKQFEDLYNEYLSPKS